MYNPSSEAENLLIYRKLSLIRQATDFIISEYPSDQIKTPVHLGLGLEGVSVGVAHLLSPQTKHFGQLRNHGQYLAVSGETDKFFAELYGKVTGMGSGKAGSMHLSSVEHGMMGTSGIVGSTISLAVGAAFAEKYQGTDAITVAMFGDAGMEEGEFWESLNFACLHKLKVMFVCEDNDIAIHTFGQQRRGFKSITEGVSGFDCNVYEGDGTDVRSVLDAVQRAKNKMMEDSKPAFLCFKWFRFLEHVGPNTDWWMGYRPEPSVEELKVLDPVHNFEEYLHTQEISEEQLQEVRASVESQIQGSVEKAKAARYPGPDELKEWVFV